MSYILDALKKSEAERSNRDHSGFAHRVPFESSPRKQREIWPYLLVLALLANVLLLVVVLWLNPEPGEATAGSSEPPPVHQQQPIERQTANTAPKPLLQEQEETRASGTSAASESGSPDTPDVSQTADVPDTPDTPEVPDIQDMPRYVQQRIMEMTFNAHLHSSNPSSRQVMINNQMLREGDRIGRLTIREITPEGVVFGMEGHVFQIDIVRDWQGAL